MSFDGVFISRLVKELDEDIKGYRINKIYQISKYELLFNVRKKETKKLFISIIPQYARIHVSNVDYDTPQTPPTFCMFLRKHLEGGYILGVEQIENDRIVKISVSNYNELGDKISLFIYIEFMGKHSNIVIVDENGKVKECIKHLFSINNSRQVKPNMIYTLPDNQDKVNPYKEQLTANFNEMEYDLTKYFIRNYQGISPFLAKEIVYHDNDLSIINRDTKATIIEQDGEKSFYCFNIDYLDGERVYYDSLSELLDTFYFQKDTYDRIKQKSKDLDKFIKRELQRNINKVEKLELQLKLTDKAEDVKILGDLILANMYNISKGDCITKVLNYYTNEEIEIELNPLLSPSENAQSYYKSYNKLRTSVDYIKNQIILAKSEIEYFTLLRDQISNAGVADVVEIREELELSGYLKKKDSKNKKKKPNFLTYVVDDVEILVGKNNIQNEHITHKLAKRNEYWMHVQNSPGSHVLIKTDTLTENIIRTSANLAAFYSKYRYSSSVAIDYTMVRNIKKIPGKRNCFVTYSGQKTIYIDPDLDEIKNLNIKK